jgi:hypothetical protein
MKKKNLKYALYYTALVVLLFVSVQSKYRNNRNKRFVWDSAETSFGSSFGCFGFHKSYCVNIHNTRASACSSLNKFVKIYKTLIAKKYK